MRYDDPSIYAYDGDLYLANKRTEERLLSSSPIVKKDAVGGKIAGRG